MIKIFNILMSRNEFSFKFLKCKINLLIMVN